MRELAERRLAAAGITPPPVMICADDVVNGKPDPEGYRKAAERLGVAPESCVVFEDAPAGIQAGERMGAAVVVINVTHSHPIETPHLSIGGYGELDVIIGDDGGLKLAGSKS
ncbi:Phosphorylated carbohydrates phosphatase [compost metagenome]